MPTDRPAPEPGPAYAEFAAAFPFALDDYQRDGCAHVEAGSGVLVAAPTGAGKTVVGEFAVFLALRVYSGRSAREILDTDADYIADIGLAKHLSPTRSNGLASLLAFIRESAQRALA